MANEKQLRLLTAGDPALVEAYNDIRSNLLARLGVRPGAGARTCPVACVAAVGTQRDERELPLNLAISFARLGLRVLLVDANYRGAEIAPALGAEAAAPLPGALAGTAKPSATAVDGLAFLSRGQYAGNPADLVGGADMIRYLDACRADYDVIFVALPSAERYAEAATLAPRTDGVIVGVTPRADKRSAVTRALENLHTVGASLLGLVSVC